MKSEGLGGAKGMLEHDRMLKQAIYNTGANVIVVLAGLGVIALYWVLESFFRPLLWAMLCGAFLHPFKYKVTRSIKSWLGGLKTSSTPLALGVFKIPVDLLDLLSENLIDSLKRRWKVIAVVVGVFLSLYVTYHHAPMDFRQVTGFVWQIYSSISEFINFFSFKWVCALVICYVVAVVRLWSPENRQLLSYLATPIWLLTMLCLIANLGALRLPLAVAIIVLMVVGYLDAKQTTSDHNGTTSSNTHEIGPLDQSDEAGEDDSIVVHEVSLMDRISHMVMSGMSRIENVSEHHEMSSVPMEEEEEAGTEAISEPIGECDTASMESIGNSHSDHSSLEGSRRGVADVTDSDIQTAGQSHKGVTQPTDGEEYKNSTPFTKRQFSINSNAKAARRTERSESTEKRKRRRSDRCFIFLFWAIALVMLWSNVWLILLPLISFVFRLLKKIMEWIQWFVTTGYQERASEELEPLRSWCEQRLGVLVPAPVRGMINILLKGDNRVGDMLSGSADTIITIMLIVLLLVSFVLISVGVCFQVQKEGIHLVTVTSNLVQNRTIQPQWFTDLFRNGTVNETTGIHSSLDPMIKNVYTFGREWIVRKISEGVSHQPSRDLVQSELVAIWDSLYDSWVTKNTTRIAKPNYNGALFSQLKEGGVDFVWQMSTVDLGGIFNFVRENIGIFQSVMESVWILLRGNVNLAFTLLISLLQIILGGSTAILNSFLSLIVFFTTLFYLLASSCEDYKPVEWISKLTIAKAGSKFAQAVEDGIGGVFAATLKMAAFYGVYTWLTHTVFGINIVFLPSVLAAVLGAIPFVGTYWAAVPAVLELSLIHKEIFLALLLAIFHVLPSFVVDTAIYSDINGGGHPYLTGLAIAGGVYCFGLQGAIVGPVLMCCIIVGMNLYSATINPYSNPPPTTPGAQPSVSRPSLTRSASTML